LVRALRVGENLNPPTGLVRPLLATTGSGRGVTGTRTETASVLIVDDDPSIWQTLSELALRGYVAETATCGADVLRRRDEGPVDATIVDIVLPEPFGPRHPLLHH
jgi:hypothetical protein